jgi:flagellar basal body-associated protein FliL
MSGGGDGQDLPGSDGGSGPAGAAAPDGTVLPPRLVPLDDPDELSGTGLPPARAASGAGASGPDGTVLPPGAGVDRTRFLESLLEDGETVPQKVELDLDGIFDQARKEADELSPDSTRTPVTAPLPQDLDFEMPAPPPEPLKEPLARKVSKFKLLFLVVPVALGALGLLFGIYQIFIKSPPAPPVPDVVISPQELMDTRDPVPGEMTLGRFTLTLDAAGNDGPAVAELEIILHYHDTADERVIRANMIYLRDVIFRIAKRRGSGILKDPAQRRQLQADLLATLNDLPHFRTDQEHQFLTYVQISLLRRV